MAGDTDTVELDFGGDFPEGASESIAAADALADALVKLQDASERVKDPKFAEAAKLSEMTSELRQQAALNAQIANFDANRVRALAAQQAQLTKMREDALGITEERARKEQEAADKAEARDRDRERKEMARLQREEQREREKDQRERERYNAERDRRLDETAKGNDAFDMAIGQGLERAGEMLLQAGERLVQAAADLVVAGAKLGIEETSKRQIQSAIGSRLGGDFDATVKMALRMGIDPDEAWQQTKKLLGDKFSQQEIPALIRIKTGMNEAGQNGEGFIGELQRLKLEPKVTSREIDHLYKMGVDSKAVYAELAKELGTNVAGAMAKVKSGTADTEKVIAAIEKVAGEKFGGIADTIGDSVPALFARVKGDAAHLFDDMDLSGPKEFLRTLAGVLEGPGGAALKGGLKDLFQAGGELFKGMDTKELTADLMTAAQQLHEMAADVRELRPEIQATAGFIKDEVVGGLILARGVIDDITAHVRALNALLHGDLGGAWQAMFGPRDQTAVTPALSPEDQKAKAGRIAGADTLDQAAPAFDAGQNMSLGMADGIRAGESEAIEASTQMATKALQAAKDALLVRSPSEAFAEVGDYSAQGMAKGMAGHPGPANAAAQMAKGALGAANDNAGLGALAGGGAGTGGNVYNFQPQIVLPPGSPAATQAAAQAGVAAAYPEFLAMTRRAGRDR